MLGLGLATWLSGISTMIAVAAFFRSDISRVYRKKRSSLEFYPFGYLEIGFGALGPTCNLVGSFWPQHYDQFINNIDIEIKRLDDYAKFDFKWFLFKPASASFDVATHTEQERHISIATPFYVSTKEGKDTSIFFTDVKRRSKFRNILEDFYLGLQKFCQLPAIQEAINNSISQGQSVSQFSIAVHYEREYPSEVNRTRSELQREFPWKSGNYKGTIKIVCGDPCKTYTYDLYFSISDHDETRLFDNVDKIILEASGVNPVKYAFAYPEYKVSNKQVIG